MSRPIKFRFWDKEHHFMWHSGMEGESIALQGDKYHLYNRHVYKELLSKGQGKTEDFQFQTHFDEKTGCLEGYVYGPAFEVTDDPFPMYDNETWLLESSEFTGLKDKNGVEIYEGDIVQARYMSFYDTGWKAVIKFGEYDQDGSGDEYNPSKCYGFYVEAMNSDEEDEDGFRKVEEYLITVSPLEFEEINVIGNIYENPELLGGDQHGQTS